MINTIYNSLGSHFIVKYSWFFFFCNKVEDAVESLSRDILTIQGKGDKGGAEALLLKHSVMTQPLKSALENLERVKVCCEMQRVQYLLKSKCFYGATCTVQLKSILK